MSIILVELIQSFSFTTVENLNVNTTHRLSGCNFIQLVPTTQYYNYVGYDKTRLIYCNFWYFNIRGLEVNVTTTPKCMIIISNQSILAIGYKVPGYYKEISVDYSYNLQGAFGVFLKIFCYTGGCVQENMLNSIVIAFYKPPTAHPPDAVFCYNVTFPVIINGTETNVEFGVYKSPVHLFYIPYTSLFGNITLYINYFTENAGYNKPYFIGIFNHAAVSTERSAVAKAIVYNWFIIQCRKVPTPPMPIILKNGILHANDKTYVAQNSRIMIPNIINCIKAVSNCSNSLAYVESNFSIVRMEFCIINGENFFGAKISSSSTLFMFLYSSIKRSSSCVVYIPLIVNGKVKIVKFYEIKCSNIIYLYPQNNIEGCVTINFKILETYFHLTGVKEISIGDVYPSCSINFVMSYQEVAPTKAKIRLNSEVPFYYINGTKYYTNETYQVCVPAIICIPNNLTVDLTRYLLKCVKICNLTLPDKLILGCGCYNITASYNIQYYLSVPFNLTGYVNGEKTIISSGWYNAGEVIQIENTTYYPCKFERYVIISVLPSMSIIVNSPINVTVSYITQFYVNVTSRIPVYAEINGTNETFVSGWYNKGSNILIENIAYYSCPFTRFILISVNPATSFTLDSHMVITVNWLEQFYVSVNYETVAIINCHNLTLKSGYYNDGTIIKINQYQYINSTKRLLILLISPKNYCIFVNSPINITLSKMLQYYVCIVLPNGTIKGWFNANSTITLPQKIEVNEVTYVLKGSNQIIISHTGVIKPCYLVQQCTTTSTSTTSSTITQSTTSTSATSSTIPSTTSQSTPSQITQVLTSAYLPILISLMVAIVIGAAILIKRK